MDGIIAMTAIGTLAGLYFTKHPVKPCKKRGNVDGLSLSPSDHGTIPCCICSSSRVSAINVGGVRWLEFPRI